MSLAPTQYSLNVTDSDRNLDISNESRQDRIELGHETIGALPIKDGDVISAISTFLNPAGGAAPTIIIDGIERTDAVLTPSMIQSAKIGANPYFAEYPKPGKERIEIETRDGGAQWHGGFTARGRDALFDARNPLGVAKPSFSRAGHEAHLGGVLGHCLSVYFSANRESERDDVAVHAYLPSGLYQAIFFLLSRAT